MKKIFFLFGILSFCYPLVYAQYFDPDKNVNRVKKDWSYTIDTTWGAGIPTEQKLLVFNTWWNRVDQTWGGFPNIEDKWDSLKIFYYDTVASGISNGRFQGILGRLTRSLKEAHSYITNTGINSTFGIYENEFPYFPSFNYMPGIPALHLSGLLNRNYFGAGVTAYNDSIALVYSVMPNHPLNLQPGDIILGYDGFPWKENLQDLLDQELPLMYGGLFMGSSEESIKHLNTSSVGLNWGLFDTIDILKYSTGDTVHYSTSLLNDIQWPYPVTVPVREQLPVNGIPFINNNDPTPVVWGIVSGTSIGYIYVYNWSASANVQALFGKAVDTLMHGHNVTGLILDFRSNGGGQTYTANDGFKHLFNEDPTSNFCDYIRTEGGGHLDFHPYQSGMISEAFFNPTSEIFDHPIAVLTGPECLSWGDMNAFRMRSHPMTRIFGKGTNGAFVSYDHWSTIPFAINVYKGLVYNGSVFSNYNNEGFMIHKGNPVDEKVWFTPEGVATGQDEIVNRALEWINNMVYPHDTKTDTIFYPPSANLISFSTVIENSNSHMISSKGYIHDLNNVLIDSVDLTKHSANSDGEIWTGNINVPATSDFFKISAGVYDQTASTYFTVPNATRFTTAGPVILDSIPYSMSYGHYYCRPFITNIGESVIKNLSGLIKSDDSRPINPATWELDSLPPGISTMTNVFVTDSLPGCFKVLIGNANWYYWEDTITVIPDPIGVNETVKIPTEFSLLQNYPNPFNPSTKIKYSIPKSSNVVIQIFGILGNELETLVNEEKPAGSYEVVWNAAHQPSGIYFCQIKAGSFNQTRK